MNDIDILTEHITGVTKGFMLAHPEYIVPEETARRLDSAIEMLESGTPLGYIIGEVSFCGERLKVTPDCLIPRSDTEVVVDKLVALMPEGGSFADLCTGSGCIAISALNRMKNASAMAVDVSQEALAIAQENAESLGVANRVVFMKADIFSPGFLDGYTFDVIVSNPPYIPTSEIMKLDAGVKKEPMIALDGGTDGLQFYKFMIPNYSLFLNEKGKLLFEIGSDQADAVCEIAARYRMSCEIFRDYGGRDRIAVIS